MTIKRKIELLSTMTNRDESGRHFSEVYTDAVLDVLEAEGFIEIRRPINESTGRGYTEEHYHLEVTQKGVDLVESYSEYISAEQ